MAKATNWKNRIVGEGEQVASPIAQLAIYISKGARLAKQEHSDWFDGPYGWVLANSRKAVEPLPYKGRLGLYDVPDELVREYE